MKNINSLTLDEKHQLDEKWNDNSLPCYKRNMTTPLYKYLETETFENILQCITTTAKKTKTTDRHVVAKLNGKYPGLSFTYLHYQETKELWVHDDQGLRVYDEERNYEYLDTTEHRENAEATVRYLHVNSTGARAGDILLGMHNISKDALLRIARGSIPPMKDDLDEVRLFPDLWTTFLSKLSSIEFFAEMTLDEREMWLEEHQRRGDYDMAEVGNVFVDVVDSGKSTFRNIDEDSLNTILGGNPQTPDGAWDLHQLREFFPRKPGSKAKRHTLIFFLRFWKVSSVYRKVTSFSGVVYDMTTGKIRKGVEDTSVAVFGGLAKKYDANGDPIVKQDFGVIMGDVEYVDYMSLLLERFSDHTQEDVDVIINTCRNFTPAGYKSLLQKIVRYAPEYVIIHDKEVEASFVLCVVLTLLMTHPGSFVPDIQRFVSGQESAFKRLAVAILEDSFVEDFSVLLRLMVTTFLSQRLSKWRPNEEDYLFLIDAAVNAVSERRMFQHDIEKGMTLPQYVISSTNSDLANVSALLDEVRSFGSDLGMVRYIAFNKGKSSPSTLPRPRTMEVHHCIDQHWAPEVVYFLPLSMVEKYRESGSRPFARIFKQIFTSVTGQNSRKVGRGLSGRMGEFTNNEVESVRVAQRLVLIAKTSDIGKRKTVEGTYKVEGEIDVSWLAGMCGPIQAKGKPMAIVTMNTTDPHQLIAIRQPSRGMKDGTLSDERSEEALQQVRTRLMEGGLPMKTIAPPLPGLDGYKVHLTEEGEYIFIKGKQIKSWAEIAHVDVSLPLHPRLSFGFEKALITMGDGVQQNADKNLKEMLSSYDSKILRRFLTYLSSHREVIEIARLSKDGGPTANAVMIEDCGTCQLMWLLTMLYPAAVQRVDGYVSKFRVKMRPLLWKIRDLVAGHLRELIDDSAPNDLYHLNTNTKVWPAFKDTSGRIPRSYQQDAVNEMIVKNQKGKKGHFLWMTVGLGKSLCAMMYLQYLQEQHALPKYIIYALPKSALKSILVEVEYFGIPINLLLPIKGWKRHAEADYVGSNDHLLPYHLNIIEHDHLRMMEEELLSKAADSFLIYDEVHKSLNDTKRTGVAIEVSRLSQDFIAMTGTPTTDSNTYKLIQWLEQVVEFEVNGDNFWVAANAMISKVLNTGIDVDKREVLADFDKESRKAYNALVPPSLGGTNVRPTAKEILKAFEICYEVCDTKIVEVTMEFVTQKKIGVMVVARNYKHQERLGKMMIEAGLKSRDLHLLKSGESLFMTDESVKKKLTPDYRVVIVPQQLSSGYTLTRMKAMVNGVYPSNAATRTQLEGRINRLTQQAKIIYYRTVHVGILTHVLKKHNDAASIQAVLTALADQV